MTAPKSTTARRAPQDRKPKAVESGPNAQFTFKHKGKSYTLAAADDVLSVGFARKNRHLTQEDQFFTILEELADEPALAAIDTMNRAEFVDFQRAFFAHSGVELGESEAS